MTRVVAGATSEAREHENRVTLPYSRERSYEAHYRNSVMRAVARELDMGDVDVRFEWARSD